jgi:hypothetical protein
MLIAITREHYAYVPQALLGIPVVQSDRAAAAAAARRAASKGDAPACGVGTDLSYAFAFISIGVMGCLRRKAAVTTVVRAEDGGDANPSMLGAEPRALARHKQSPGLFVSGLSPPPSLTTGLLLCFPDSLPRHPRLGSNVLPLALQSPTSSTSGLLRRRCNADERKARGLSKALVFKPNCGPMGMRLLAAL